jgi:hypothetical protein
MTTAASSKASQKQRKKKQPVAGASSPQNPTSEPSGASSPRPISALKANPRNPRLPFSESQADAFKRSLAEYGDLSGIIENQRTGQTVGGHKRCQQFASDPKAAIVVTDMLETADATGTLAYGYVETGGTRFAYRLVDWPESKEKAANLAANQFGAEFDWLQVQNMLTELDGQVDLSLTGFSAEEMAQIKDSLASEVKDETYSGKIVVPVYEPKGERPAITEMIDREKTKQLIAEIDAAKLPKQVAEFMRFAAERHTVFNFRQIAEFYCHADAKVQSLMEKSALVIIDFNKAIENGFVHLTERLGALADQEEEDANA